MKQRELFYSKRNFCFQLLGIFFLSLILIPGMTKNGFADLTTGLVAHYPFNGNANDESGNGNNGTVYEATLTNDRNGNADSAYSFDGTNDYIEVADSNSLDMTNSITITSWVYLRAFNTNMQVVQKDSTSGLHAYAMPILSAYNGGNSKRFGLELRLNGSFRSGMWSNNTLQENTWYFLATTFDGSNVRLYLNGNLDNSYLVSGTIETNNNPLHIGNFRGYNTDFLNGIIDNIRIYNRALSESEIQSLYNETIPTPTPAPSPSPGGTWTQLIQNGTSIGGMAYAYDSNRNRGVIFGGDNSSLNQLSSTYEWNGTSWVLITSSGPSSRANSAMTFDTIRSKCVLFGGWVKPDNYHGDTWTWDGTQWSQVSSTGPNARANQAMAFDSARGKVVLFGGSYYQTIYGDTWEWDGTSWTQVSSSGPSSRLFARMAYDEARGKVVLFGGQTTYYGTFLNDTWEWNGTTWTQVASTGPSTRSWHTMAYDSTKQRVVLFGGGGWGRAASFNDLWEWNGNSWVQVNASGPSARIGSCLFYDTTLNAMILYGGYNNGSNYSTLGDTWKYVAPDSATDTKPPEVNTTSPANGATDVAVNSTITASFSETMDVSTITTATFTVSDGSSNIIDGTVSYSGTTATFSPSSNLVYSTSYTATITTGVKDLAGNEMTTPHTWNFTTGPQPNSAPVANAGTDQSVYVGNTVTLDGSGSTDADGDILTYSWSFTKIPSGSTAALSDITSVNPTFTVDKAGTYIVSLTVSDGSLSNTDTVMISTINVAPVANAGADQSVYVDNTVTLDGSGSSDANGDLLTYSWTFTSKPSGSSATLSNPDTVNPTFTVDKAGTYEVSLVVNDGTVNSDTDTVSISTINVAPIADAGIDQSVYVSDLVTLDGSLSSDSDGDQITYTWAFTTKPDGSVASLSDTAAVNPTFTVDKAGTYVVSLVVNDGTANSEADTLTISTINVAPVANAGSDQLITLIGTTVQLDGTQSYDPDGDDIIYQWSFVSKPSGSSASFANSDTANPTFVADTRGDYIIQLEVSDASTQSLPDTVTISFENIKPVADAGMSQSVNVGETVTIDGSGSTDGNGDSLTYTWTFSSLPDGNLSEIANPSAMVTTFVPDKSGTYVVQLIVNDGTVDSDPSTVQIQAVDVLTAAIQAIQDCETEITSLDSSVFKNTNMQNTLINKLNAVIANIEAGNYADALGQLQNDILGKTDGCATSDAPDKNDWIKSCEAQSGVYQSIQYAISVIEGLIP